MTQLSSPFSLQNVKPLSRQKFSDPAFTATGELRAHVNMTGLSTLWFNTGTLCNLACKSCYIDSSPTNDALVYITLNEVRAFLDEIVRDNLPTREIAFTGGEPFMNCDLVPIIQLCLNRGFDVLVLSNAMRPMRRFERALLAIEGRERLTIRVSLDHFTCEIHEAERGDGAWAKAIDGLIWLSANRFKITVAGRRLGAEADAECGPRA